MKVTRKVARHLRTCCGVLALLLSGAAAAQSHTEMLRRCLSEFDGLNDDGRYTALARYSRSAPRPGPEAVLTWRTQAKNTWLVTLRLPADAAGTAR